MLDKRLWLVPRFLVNHKWAAISSWNLLAVCLGFDPGCAFCHLCFCPVSSSKLKTHPCSLILILNLILILFPGFPSPQCSWPLHQAAPSQSIQILQLLSTMEEFLALNSGQHFKIPKLPSHFVLSFLPKCFVISVWFLVQQAGELSRKFYPWLSHSTVFFSLPTSPPQCQSYPACTAADQLRWDCCLNSER